MGFQLAANAICYFVGSSDELTDQDLKRMKESGALESSIKDLAESTYKFALGLRK